MKVKTSCAYCGVGCGVEISSSNSASQLQNTDNSSLLMLAGDRSHPANHGALCAKGGNLLASLEQPDVLRYPITRSGKVLQWDEAIGTIAQKFTQTIREYGPGSVAFYLSGQLLTEDYYVANKLAKGFIKTANVDTNSRLCMSSAVSAHQRAFGEDIVPACYDDIDEADVIVLVGANTAWTHPVLFKRILAAQASRQTKLIVIDPRNTSTAQQADLHLAINPGKDSLLFNQLLAYLVEGEHVNQQYIEQHTEGFEHTLKAIETSMSPKQVSEQLGISVQQLNTFFSLFTSSSRILSASCQGVNQSVIGTDTTNAMINCHLALGQIGQVGAGFLSLTGQPNAMGGREVGGLATQLACHMGFSEPEAQLLADFWQTNSVVTNKGLTAVDMFDAIADGTIKAVWILGTNPVVSLPQSNRVKKALEDCPFVVVSELTSSSDTALTADLLLPALGWSQKDGTVTNSERVISRQRAFMPVKGVAKPDWQAICEVATAMGFAGFEYQTNAEVFTEFARLSQQVCTKFPSKKFNISGLADLSKQQYDDLLPTQWPIVSQKQMGQTGQRIFTDGQFSTSTGKAQFIDTAFKDCTDKLNSSLILNSGRSRDQWHTMTRTGHIANLRAAEPEPTIYLHSSTIKSQNLAVDSLVELTGVDTKNSATKVLARLNIDDGLPTNMAFMPMHWSQQFSQALGVNQLSNNLVDPFSKQPAFKQQKVQLSNAAIVTQGIVFGDITQSSGLLNGSWKVQHTLQHGQCWHVGFNSPFTFNSPEKGFELQWSLNLTAKDCLSDQGMQQLKVQIIIDDNKLASVAVLSNTKVNIVLEAVSQLIGMTLDGKVLKQLSQLLKAGASPLVCACTGVTQADIEQSLDNQRQTNLLINQSSDHSCNATFEHALDITQQTLGCGRQCGSCNSEVKQHAKDYWQRTQAQEQSLSIATKELVS